MDVPRVQRRRKVAPSRTYSMPEITSYQVSAILSTMRPTYGQARQQQYSRRDRPPKGETYQRTGTPCDCENDDIPQGLLERRRLRKAHNSTCFEHFWQIHVEHRERERNPPPRTPHEQGRTPPLGLEDHLEASQPCTQGTSDPRRKHPIRAVSGLVQRGAYRGKSVPARTPVAGRARARGWNIDIVCENFHLFE